MRKPKLDPRHAKILHDRAKALAEFERWFAKLVRANNALIKLRRRLKRLASAEQAFRGGVR